MTETSTQSSHQVRNTAVGSYVSDATAAAFKITCGFKPRFVRVVNEDGDCHLEWYEGMAAAEGMKMLTGGTYAKQTTLGITVAEDGFTVGLDTDINVINQQLSWMAIG